MPLIAYDRQHLEEPVADHNSGLKQRGRFAELHLLKDPATGVATLALKVNRVLFQNLAGGFGDEVHGLKTDFVPLTANNNTAVDPATGTIRYMRRDETEQEWLDFLNARPEPLLGQGDWVDKLLTELLAPLIRANIVAANEPPFSKF